MIIHTGAHRVLPDVLAMEAVMTHPLLASSLTKIPVQSAKKLEIDCMLLHRMEASSTPI